MLSKVLHSYSPSNTYCIHFCGNLSGLCIEQRSLFGELASAMVAICFLHHASQHHLHWDLSHQLHLLHPPNSIWTITKNNLQTNEEEKKKVIKDWKTKKRNSHVSACVKGLHWLLILVLTMILGSVNLAMISLWCVNNQVLLWRKTKKGTFSLNIVCYLCRETKERGEKFATLEVGL